MSDPWVTNVQTWINTAYAHVSGVPTVTVNGKTGWPTMYALTRALQHELGITALSDTFGEGTYAALLAYGNISGIVPPGPATLPAVLKYRRLVKLVQAAMYCKGYNGGNGEIDGIWSTTTTAGITALRGDMAVSTTNKTVSPKIFKALLNMDAYVLVDGGSSTIRAIQRELNTKYAGNRKEFYIIPTDGFYSRDVQRGMMYAIQYELGMNDNVANGNFGPGTRTGLTEQADFGVGSTGSFLIKLYQAALIFNGFTTAYTATFTANTAGVTREFQAFCKLSTTGRSDFRTWASLLVSTGDTTRPGTACDTIREITPARAATLKSAGYTTIGRYLTNTRVTDPLDKNIKPGELQAIFNAGLKVFPIFQEGGTGTSYFSYENGEIAGYRAHEAAASYGFKTGTTIYFAVDFDAMQDEVLEHVVPYFEGVKWGIENYGSKYRVGIYGSRNTCIQVSERGLAEFSFVSGMSTGFSGNLGYPLPSNWAFDQILEYEVGEGLGWVNIDKNIQSGRDQGQSSVTVNTADAKLDVQLKPELKAGMRADLVGQLAAELSPLQVAGAVRPIHVVVEHLLSADALITNLSREFKIRKSFIQTVFAWEGVCTNWGDILADTIVMRSNLFRHGGNDGTPPPPVPAYDSSTGLCQIFAKRAIEASNWGRLHGLSTEPSRSFVNLDHLELVWNRLGTENSWNIRMAALALVQGAAFKQVQGSLLAIHPDQVEVVLASYNDGGYGVKTARIYNVLEAYNKASRA
ncbi:glycoside hydrolase domain-containing protein [Pseudoclavibacter sp. Z016]|uniref:glycoside hydrolase domain-containing protein n=1 Tax=Pseudoclavibacter sp. Z016 TaxID=2080581 RepID=UPI000CE7D0B3|nr:glycoside hydrolase domain-containing protein [Pseudoclavibacter sp. Z016]PPF72613.1 hypothetical protein C5B99_17385 [Pseudoclavibacter sp. Z016]